MDGSNYYVYVNSHQDGERDSFDLEVKALKDSDIDAQCLEETTELYNTGVKDELQFVVNSVAEQMDWEEDCTIKGQVFSCEFDMIEGLNVLNELMMLAKK
jgi:hypothetical protein